MKAIAVLALLSVMLLACCGESTAPLPIPETVLREGDLALRLGTSLASKVVIMLDSAGQYSHIGIVARRGNQWVVVHAVPDERDDGGRDTVKADPIGTFLLPARAAHGAIVRINATELQRQRAAREALRLVEAHTEFDHEYDWTDTTRLYCTQLVQRCYEKAGIDLSQGRTRHVDAPGYHGSYVFPSQLIMNEKAKLIFNY